jgi:hypothetical protein
MNCKVFSRKIYLSDELTEKEKEKLQSHLNRCVTCSQLKKEWDVMRKQFEEIRKTNFYLSSPEMITANIMSSLPLLPQRADHRAIHWLGKRVVQIAATILLVLQPGLFFWQQNNDLQTKAGLTKYSTQQPLTNNPECFKKMEILIADIYQGDPDFRYKTDRLLKRLKSKEMSRYTKQICEYASLIENDQKNKDIHKMIYEIIEHEFIIN